MSFSAFSMGAVLLLAFGHTGMEENDYVRLRTSTGQCLWWPGEEFLTWTANEKMEEWAPGALGSIQRAFGVWQAQMDTCGSLHFHQLSPTSAADTGYLSKNASENLILFRQGSCQKAVDAADPCWQNNSCANTYNCWQYDESALAITLTTFLADTGRLLDADIEINGNYTYAVDRKAPCQSCFFADLEAVMLHEVGHLLGLGHSTKRGSVMYPTLAAGLAEDYALDADSAQFVCEVYPKNRPAQGCGENADMPARVVKNSGCTAQAGGGAWLVGLLAAWLGLRRKAVRG